MATPIPSNEACFDLGEIANETGGTVIGSAAVSSVRGVVTDSRKVQPGNLYVALRGDRLDGHRFVDEAFARGAVAALVDERSVLSGTRRGVLVGDTLHALGTLARSHRRRWGGRIAAITGSAGKTTTKELTFAALQATGARAARTLGNLNNLIGAPMSLLGLDSSVDLAVIEIGTSAPGEIARLAEICEPQVGVVTSVSAAHTLGLGTIEQVAHEKASLLWALAETGTAIYCADDPQIAAQLGRIRARQRVPFGTSDRAAVRLLSQQLTAAPSMHCQFDVRESGATLTAQLQVFGAGPALDAAAAIATVLALLGPDVLTAAVEGLAQVTAVPGRLCPLPGPAGALILDDSYNANPGSMKISIETALELAELRGGRALLVLGDMAELGGQSRSEHEAIGRQAARRNVAALLACGVEMTAAAAAAREQARDHGQELSIAHLSDCAGAAALLRPLLRSGDVVLIKGSRSSGMERVARDLSSAVEAV
jgi:UDP-N-acetylmuramoyl-tripeptide--D-alanyl-D-alanine ligase